MGNFRRWSKDVVIAAGGTLVIQDPPVSEPLMNFSVHVNPGAGGPTIKGTGGSVAWTVYHGRIQKATGTLASGATILPLKLHVNTDMIDGDRVMRGNELMDDPNVARTLKLVNNLTGDAFFAAKIIFISENVISNN